jgi:hypothetical protein
MTDRSRPTFEGSFPNITLSVNDCGMVEIGYDPNTDSFVRAIDEGGMVVENTLKSMLGPEEAKLWLYQAARDRLCRRLHCL